MKQKIVYSLLSLLLLAGHAHAQSNRGLKVGDAAPEFKPYKWIKGTPIQKFEKGHVYVVEFGATWCTPCIALIPHLTELSKTYAGKVTVISTFVMEYNKEPLQTPKPKYVTYVESFIEGKKNAIGYDVAIDTPDKGIEKAWLRAAGLQGIPFAFIIDKEGKIADITQGPENLEASIKTALAKEYNIGNQVTVTLQKEVAKVRYDKFKPLLIDGNGGQSNDFLFRSVITEFKNDVPMDVPLWVSSNNDAQPKFPRSNMKGVFQATGATLKELYMLAYSDTLNPYLPYRNVDEQWPDANNRYLKTAYGKFWYEPILELHDKGDFVSVAGKSPARFNYSAKVPASLSSARLLQRTMRNDLNNYFGYEVTVEERMMPYYKVILLPGAAEKLKAEHQGMKFHFEVNDDIPLYRRTIKSNAVMGDLLDQLQLCYGFGMYNQGVISKDQIAPFIDETNFTGEFDLRWEPVFNSSIDAQRQYLNTIGIDVVRSERLTKVIVIHDPAY